jgi:hypothetical protein
MDKSTNASPLGKSLLFSANYTLGFVHWVAGSHCWFQQPEGRWAFDYRRWRGHVFKVFLWSLEVSLLINLLGAYRDWLIKAALGEVAMAIVVKSVVFLYVKVFWPRVFPEILPGLRLFFCPQCYRRQTFKFMPVSIRFGHYVTYLCKHCACLVDGWGNQIFHPSDVELGKGWAVFYKTLVASLAIVLLGYLAGDWIWGWF